jgi:hypothetical protein
VFVNISKYKVFPETVDVFITAPVTEILKVWVLCEIKVNEKL